MNLQEQNKLANQPLNDQQERLLAEAQQFMHLNNPGPVKNNAMITNVTVRPNAEFSSMTIDVTCEHSRHSIVRLFNPANRIIKMFSWFLIKGTNITTLSEINGSLPGEYKLDIIDSEGKLLYAVSVNRQ